MNPGFKITTNKFNKYVIVKITGIINNIQEWTALNTRISEEIFKNKVTKAVIDETELTFPDSVVQIIQTIEHYLESLPREVMSWHIAAAIPKDREEIGRLWETACRNRSFLRFNIFFDLNKAIDWIKEQ